MTKLSMLTNFEEIFEDVTKSFIKIDTDQYLEKGTYPVIDQGEKPIAGFTDLDLSKCDVQPPFIVFGDHTRRFKYIDFDCCLGADGAKVLKPKIDADVKFLFYALKNTQLENNGYSRHYKFLKRKSIYLPPLAEQQRIASILDKAELVKRKRELAVIGLGTLSKEIFIGMFSDLLEKPNTTLGSFFDVRDGTHDSPKYQTKGHPLITSKNLNNNTINLEDVSFINLEDFEAINRRSKVDYCDILMPMIGTIGNPVIVHDKNPQFAIKNVALIKTGNMEASFYVKGLLETQYFKRYVSKESKGGTQKFLSLGNIRNFPIYVPSDAQLQKFSTISKALIQVQSSLVKSQRKLDELLSSLQFSFMTSN